MSSSVFVEYSIFGTEIFKPPSIACITVVILLSLQIVVLMRNPLGREMHKNIIENNNFNQN
jgi:hypothetical protein